MSESIKVRKQELTKLINSKDSFHVCDVFQRMPNSCVRLVFGYNDKAYTGLGFSCVLSSERALESGSDLAFNNAVDDIVYQIMADEVKAFFTTGDE